MVAKYYSILTNRGKELEAQSSAAGEPVILKSFVVGDGNGQAVTPDPAKTALVHEVYRSDISSLDISTEQSNQWIAHLVLPADVGGFTVREMGLLTDAGELYAVCNCAAIEKPESGVSVNVQFRLAVSETAEIELIVATGDGLFLRQDANLGDVKDKTRSRTNLGLGTAATYDATTTKRDAADNRLLKTGGFGIGDTVGYVTSDIDFQTYGFIQGEHLFVNMRTCTNIPGGLRADNYYFITVHGIRDSDSSPALQIVSYADPGEVWFAYGAGSAGNRTWKAYRFYSSGYKPSAADTGAVPVARKVNGHALTTDINVTSQDIFNGQSIGLGANQNLDNYKTPGVYYQPANSNASAALKYPENSAGTLMVYKNAGVTQVYYAYNSSRIWSRSQYSTGAWTPWAREYNTLNKPSAYDVGAIAQDSCEVAGFASNNAANPYMRHKSSNAVVTLAPQSWVWATFQPKGNYTPAGQAYTKAESNSRYVQNIRLGARTTTPVANGNWSAANGGVITEYNTQREGIYRLFQRNVNGTWATISVL